MKKDTKKGGSVSRVPFHAAYGEDCVENSKRRRMFSLISGDLKFFERLLAMKHYQDPIFLSKTVSRGR